jgi:hypothetical protein
MDIRVLSLPPHMLGAEALPGSPGEADGDPAWDPAWDTAWDTAWDPAWDPAWDTAWGHPHQQKPHKALQPKSLGYTTPVLPLPCVLQASGQSPQRPSAARGAQSAVRPPPPVPAPCHPALQGPS